MQPQSDIFAPWSIDQLHTSAAASALGGRPRRHSMAPAVAGNIGRAGVQTAVRSAHLLPRASGISAAGPPCTPLAGGLGCRLCWGPHARRTAKSGLQITAAAKSKGKKTQKPQKSAKRKKSPDACPCGSGRAYAGCCEPYHLGADVEPTADSVMRARFSAYAKGLPQYVVDSTHLDCPMEAEFKQEDGTYGPGFLQDASDYCERYTFTKLSILQKTAGENDDEAMVCFKVWYRVTANAGDQQTMTEQSVFRRVDGRWLYYDRLGALD